MKLRQAAKILKRIYACNVAYNLDGVPLPKSWRRYMFLWHKATAVYNHHSGPFGRLFNRCRQDHAAKICKSSNLHEEQS